MLAPMAGLLPVLTIIAGPDGTRLPDAERVQFLSPLEVEHVPAVGAGPATIEISVSNGFPAGTLGKLDFVREVGIPGGTDDSATLILFANLEAPTHVNQVTFVPEGPLTASDTNYRTVQVVHYRPNGTSLGDVGDEVTTMTEGSGGTGNWSPAADAFTIVLNYDLPAGHRLVAQWGHVGSKVLPSGAWVFS
jgi:hypothetical protein